MRDRRSVGPFFFFFQSGSITSKLHACFPSGLGGTSALILKTAEVTDMFLSVLIEKT